LDAYEDIEASYLEKMRAAVRHWQQYWNYVMQAHRSTVPLVFCSVFVRDCVSRGLCMDDGGAVLNRTPTTLSSGLVNVANSLAAIRQLCSIDRVCSLEELRQAVAKNWAGHEALRERPWALPNGATTTTLSTGSS
jgi:pyruvate-formate lyase